jgi:WD40 repeat protein/transcriptional regulator with XRE-family HTH domain
VIGARRGGYSVVSGIQSGQIAADPERIATQQDFGRELTLVRTLAGLTVRQVARAAGVPISTTGDYFSGRHLPGNAQPEQLVRMLQACGITDTAEQARWLDALRRARRSPGKKMAGDAPYRGLARYEPDDARWFFGREEIADRLAELARESSADNGGLPLVLVGPSGSGKSSLLRAGLIPRLTGQSLVLDPTVASGAALRAQLAELSRPGSPDELANPADLTVIVDQFEAVFTHWQDEAERRAFVADLCELAGRCLVVLALRADFYERALRYPGLARALQARQVVLTPMTAEQVRRAITEPARIARLDVEDGLVRLLLRDLAPPARAASTDEFDVPQPDADQLGTNGRGSRGLGPDVSAPQAGLNGSEGDDASAGPDGASEQPAQRGVANGHAGGYAVVAEPGAYETGQLPLLSHAMLATWENSRGGVLTIADYLASGGIRDALVRTAEGAYAALQPAEQQLARRLFLQLVHLADNAPPTRATVELGELRGWGGENADHALSRFVDERLITVTASTAQITHDALLTGWPRLRSWVDAGRDDLRTRRRIREAARAWREAGRETAALWRGSQLAHARDWISDEDNRASLGTLAAEFVNAAIAADQARDRAERRRARRLQRLVAALTVLVVAVCGLAAYAFQQRQVALTARDDANSREIAVEAGQVRGLDAPIAAQLGVAAYRTAQTPQAVASLIESTGSPSAERILDSADVVQSVSLSPDHKVLAIAAADGSLRLWNIARTGHPVPIGRPLADASADPLYTTAFSPNGKILAAAGAGRSISLWNVSNPAHPVLLGKPLAGPTNTIYSVAFSPDGRTLAAGSADDTARLWNISVPSHPVPLGQPLTGATGYIEAVAFAPGGTMLALGSADGTVRLWNIANPARPVPVGVPLTGPGNIVTSVTFSPDGGLLAAGSEDDEVWLWKVGPDGAVPDGTLTTATDWVNAVAFSPDGTELAAGSSDDSVLVWDVTDRSLIATLPHPQPVTSLVWVGPGRLAAGDADGTVSLWQVPPPVLLAGSPAYDAVYSPDGKMLAVSSQDSLQLWSATGHRQLDAQPVPGTFVNAVEFAPHGHILAATYGNGMFQLWSTAGGDLVPLGQPVQASAVGMTETVAFSPDGQLVATGGDDGTLRLWSVRDPARPKLLATERDSGTYVFGAAFSPNGTTVAAASADNLTRLWDVADPARPVLLGRPLRGPSSYAISVAFSPDGSLLAVGSADQTVRLWDVKNPARPQPVGTPLTGPTGYIYGVAFSADGKTLAAAVTDGTVWLWNVARPAHPDLVATLTGPNGHVYSVDFAPAGSELAAASADGTVRLWNTSPAAAAAAVCAGSGQAITRHEWVTYVPGVSYQRPCG